MQHIYIGRQPIIDSNSKLCAYEILYKGSEAALSRYSSASIINNVLNKFGTKSLLGDRPGFVKIDEKFLMHDIIFSIPKEFFIFNIDENVPMNERVVERIEQLHDKGYLLSLNNLSIDEDTLFTYEKIFSKLKFITIKIKQSDRRYLHEMIDKLQKENITVVAADVDTAGDYNQARELGCNWYEGYFFSKPVILENAKYEPSQSAVLKLYNLLMQDVNIDEIAQEFEDNHEVTVQLLQFINSGAFNFRTKISSIHHVLTLVGRIPLAQWLMLMIYSKSVTKDGHSPLMLMVRNRTELMENVLKIIQPNVRSNMLGEAYFVGVLSLIDTIFKTPLSKILQEMNISDEVEKALLYKKGVLGEIYQLVKYIEEFNTEEIHSFEKKFNLPMESIERIALESMRSVNKFEKPEVA